MVMATKLSNAPSTHTQMLRQLPGCVLTQLLPLLHG
jgi:hypothetical protein